MLEHLPAWLGKAMSGWRAGVESLAITRADLVPTASLSLNSPAFGDMARLPERFTADGAGVSPPLFWSDPPAGTAMLALLVEDADAPTPQPLVHAILWNLPPRAGELAEGAIVADGPGSAEQGDVGRNSYLGEGWLPPDPPRGHGEHRYVFQLFALDAVVEIGGETPGRGAMLDAMAGHVLAAGVLTGTYSREEEAPVGPVGAIA
ncbi:phosphatidylethanolamine-binding family protein [Sphingomonas sp. S17]|uniref:YbhB/YbcL family Raf kinase inhibitor-like protein n=2 Tax=Sphingomonas paucimobilis TaxID=13689 RepID=A0A411LKI7_SPHPI|nr:MULTISPECIES: YbhB/YbcL family Raf kinase inhibitor-like protein [Sphingomonas]EGI53630.1 phosphatidylethanolamine-binding family protein [Sphingomonas sp. S17]MBQ1481660.1 YbhB/YbcL family Raf kinase inhibitor-like protein [Sphingomonas sp.]MCM3680577.1 YbhB/YbcL family Raf kinase inhibitor-like protein [Sphingomonas paucimobilis]MDG5969996.1 YbhB/YbcL family Raf kinase inhibitor-like protein [Sphingomonas paucimobilis]NNG59662.1 YbhB/YbcL family Raf kinase inhibitor-like protein [Sphingom